MRMTVESFPKIKQRQDISRYFSAPIFTKLKSAVSHSSARFTRERQSTWCLPRGSIRLRLDRKAAIFLIAPKTLIDFPSTFILMGAPDFVTGGV